MSLVLVLYLLVSNVNNSFTCFCYKFFCVYKDVLIFDKFYNFYIEKL